MPLVFSFSFVCFKCCNKAFYKMLTRFDLFNHPLMYLSNISRYLHSTSVFVMKLSVRIILRKVNKYIENIKENLFTET